MLREIVERTTRAQETLDRETDRIRQLRDLERDAPNTLVELPGRIEAVEDRLPAAGTTFAGLQRYAPTTWQPVARPPRGGPEGPRGARDAVIVGSARDEPTTTDRGRRGDARGARGHDRAPRAAGCRSTSWPRSRRGGAPRPDELAEAERDLAEARAAAERWRPTPPSRSGPPRPMRPRGRPTVGSGQPAPTPSRRSGRRPRPTAWPMSCCCPHGARPRRGSASWQRPTRRSGRRQRRSIGRRPSSPARRRGVGETARTRLAEAPTAPGGGDRRLPRRTPPRPLEDAAAGPRPSPRRPTGWPRPTSTTGTRAVRAGASAARRERRRDREILGADPGRGHRWRRPLGRWRRLGRLAVGLGWRWTQWGPADSVAWAAAGAVAAAASARAASAAAGGGGGGRGAWRPLVRQDGFARSAGRAVPYRHRTDEGDDPMAQTSILGRVGQLVRANINAILDERRGSRADARPARPRLHEQHRGGRGRRRPDDRQPAPGRGRRARGPHGARSSGSTRPRPRPAAPTSSAPRGTPRKPTGSTSWPRSPSAAR